MVVWFSLAALAKETAILVPIALFARFAIIQLRKSFQPRRTPNSTNETPSGILLLFLLPIVPLSLWYAYHYLHTGFVFGNPEFFRYNVQATLHPLRIALALLLRVWQTAGYPTLYVLTRGC
jgi:hypothetical protein